MPALIEASKNCQMIAVGARGHSQVASLILGSVAAHTCAHAQCPVVVVRGALRRDGQVVVGVDGSSASEPALDVAFTEASTRGVRLDAVYAYDAERLTAEGLWQPPADPLGQATTEAAALLSEALAGWREKFPDVTVRQRLVRDHPVAALIDASDAARLIVLGSRVAGRSSVLCSVRPPRRWSGGSGCPAIVAR